MVVDFADDFLRLVVAQAQQHHDWRRHLQDGDEGSPEAALVEDDLLDVMPLDGLASAKLRLIVEDPVSILP